MAARSNSLRSNRVTRRDALKAGAAAVAGAALWRVRPAGAAALAQQLRIASVGVGNKGWSDLTSIASAEGAKIVALCDVDENFLAHARAEFKDARAYRDYRRMLDEMGDQLDAVVVSTPDHMHGAISLAAMSLGKHVYVQKPLAHNLAELREMVESAAAHKVVTQMGTQIHGDPAYRTAAKMLREGALGRVREAHLWVSGDLPLPATERPAKADPVPATLDWKLWQGVAPQYPYAEGLYHPFKWRQWRDYGTGRLGDMGCHIFDPIFTGLELRPPTAVKSSGPTNLRDTYSPDIDVTFTFDGTPHTAETFTIRWTNGKFKPELAQAHLPADLDLPGGGSVVIGERGAMLLPHWAMPTFYRDGAPMGIEVESAGGVDHYHEWVAACRGEGATSTPFSYGGMVTEAVLTGVVATSFPGQSLAWNSAALTFDQDAATALVHRKYRDDWRPLGM
jgi:predicted dehydrogenase